MPRARTRARFGRFVVIPESRATAPPPVPTSPAGFSPFVARVLDQLSVTAWLPAALVVVNLAVVIGLHFLPPVPGRIPIDSLRLVAESLNSKPIGIIIALGVGLVIFTLIAQSLEFAAIRFLEGYWGGSMIAVPFYAIGTTIQQATQSRLANTAERQSRTAFKSCLPAVRTRLALRSDRLSRAVVDIANGQMHRIRDGILRSEALEYFESYDWLDLVSPRRRHRLALVDRRLQTFPPDISRLMPTRLGNVLRATEDRLRGEVAGPKLREYVVRNLEKFSTSLIVEHDQYRNRLDMYAVLTLSSAALAVLNLWALQGPLGGDVAAWVCGAFVVLALLSYRGAISAAGDYSTILETMDEIVVDN